VTGLFGVERAGDAVLVRFLDTEALTVAEAAALDTEAGAVPAVPLVVVDLSGLHVLDGAGVGALIRWQRRLQESGAQLRLAAPGREVTTILQLLRLHRLFEVYDRVDAALSDEGLDEL